MSFSETFKSDTQKTAYRVAANQVTNLAKSFILEYFKSKKVKSVKLKVISEILDSEIGNSIISTSLGYMLTYLPFAKDDSRAKLLAQEFRVSGMAFAGNVIIDIISAQFMPSIIATISSLPISEPQQLNEKQEVANIYESAKKEV
jgi:prolipoprotein diacylglyceryltransferase